jgi:hypothetical protein
LRIIKLAIIDADEGSSCQRGRHAGTDAIRRLGHREILDSAIIGPRALSLGQVGRSNALH